jgi:hypothetical protein
MGRPLAGGQAWVPAWSHAVSDRVPGSSRGSREGVRRKVPAGWIRFPARSAGPCRPEGCRLAGAIPLTTLGGRYA